MTCRISLWFRRRLALVDGRSGVASGGDDGGVEQVVSDAGREPVEVAYVMVIDGTGEFDFQGEDLAIAALHDEVDLSLTASGWQVS